VLFASVALIAGFLLLLSSTCGLFLASFFAQVTHWSLSICEAIVDYANRMPYGQWYVDDISVSWLWIFYLGIVAFLLLDPLQRRWRWMIGAAFVWLGIGLVGEVRTRHPDYLRCTFLAVGHGGCTVVETPDGRVLLYDAGAMTGPEVTERTIAPFLWSRGIRCIDEVFLSHADLDHFNGVPALLDRFPVAQITCTPTFAEKPAPGVAATLAAIRRHEIPMRVVTAGDRLRAGGVELSVLHPPAIGPVGRENFRSMVLHIRYGSQCLLLTGDLEGPGLADVASSSLPRVTVLMAPHHGSRAGNKVEKANRAELLRRTNPCIIVACQGRTSAWTRNAEPYADARIPYIGTWPHGAITCHYYQDRLVVETFRTGRRLVVPTGAAALVVNK
jgi:competence protein ComEC